MLEDHYTSYKRHCEELIAGKALNYSVIRPAPVYGPGSKSLKSLVSLMRRMTPLWIPFAGDGKNLAPLIYVKDLARAVYLAGVSARALKTTFNLTDGQRHSWHDFLGAIAKEFGREMRIIPLSPLLLAFPAICLDFVSWPFGVEADTKNYIKYFSRDVHFDNKRAVELLGWEPEYTLEEGIAEMLRQ